MILLKVICSKEIAVLLILGRHHSVIAFYVCFIIIFIKNYINSAIAIIKFLFLLQLVLFLIFCIILSLLASISEVAILILIRLYLGILFISLSLRSLFIIYSQRNLRRRRTARMFRIGFSFREQCTMRPFFVNIRRSYRTFHLF